MIKFSIWFFLFIILIWVACHVTNKWMVVFSLTLAALIYMRRAQHD